MGLGSVLEHGGSSAAQPKFPIFSATKISPMPALKSVIFGPSIPKDPLVTVVPSILRQVLNFISISPSCSIFKHLTLIDIDHDNLIPLYFSNMQSLIHLSFILHPQLGDQALEKIAIDYMDTEEGNGVEEKEDATEAEENVEDEVDLEILDAPPAVFQTPNKKKTLKVKEKLDDSFLRHSKRISNKLKGYMDALTVPRRLQLLRMR